MNLTMEEIANQTAGATKDRMKIGSSLADVDPMSVDRSVSLSSINEYFNQVPVVKKSTKHVFCTSCNVLNLKRLSTYSKISSYK